MSKQGDLDMCLFDLSGKQLRPCCKTHHLQSCTHQIGGQRRFSRNSLDSDGKETALKSCKKKKKTHPAPAELGRDAPQTARRVLQ